MRKTLIGALALAFTLTVSPGARAAHEDILVSIEARGNDISTVLSGFARQSGISLMLEPGASGRVDVNLESIPFEAALGAVVRSAGLDYTRILVPKNSTAVDIQNSFNAVSYAPRTNIVVDANPTQPATAILSGSEVANAWKVASELGMREVYWVHKPRAASAEKPLAAPTTDSPSEQESGTEEGVGAGTVYSRVTKALSELQPDEAYALLQQVQGEVVRAMEPQDWDPYFLAETGPLAYPYPPNAYEGPIRMSRTLGPAPVRRGFTGYDPVVRRQGYVLWPY